MITVRFVTYKKADEQAGGIVYAKFATQAVAKRGKAQKGLAAITKLLLNAQQRGDIIAHRNHVGMIEVDFEFTNGNVSYLTIWLS